MTSATFAASDPEYAQRVRSSFSRQGAMKLIQAELTHLAPGFCAIAVTPRPEIMQQHGYVHAGIVSTLVDTAGGFAGYTLFPADSSVLTVEFKVNLLAPATGDRIVAEGHVVRQGRTLVALMQQTLMVMHGKPDLM